MESIDLIRKLLRLFGILERVDGEKFLGIMTTSVIFTAYAIYFFGTLLFCAFFAQNLDEFWECLFYLLCAVLVIAWYATLVSQRTNYNDLLDDLEAIIEKRKRICF